jgi:hypothetical protein
MHGIKRGIYTPQNIQKYIGKNLPTYRSSWELKAFISLDRNPKISKWGSENFVIPYIDTTRNNETHRYIIDIFFEIADYTKNGLPIKWLIEIKPYSQSVTPKARKGKSTQKLLNETIIVERNKCKWKSAIAFCKAKGWHFGVYTEKGITKLC